MKKLSQSAIFQKIGYEPHAGQVEIHRAQAQARFIVASCGRRFGKSQSGGHRLTEAAFKAYFQQNDLSPKGKRHEYWIIGPEYSDSEKEFRVLYNDISKLGIPMDHPGTYYSETADALQLSLFGGRFLVKTKSAKYPGTLVGEGLMGVILAEAAKLKSVVWTKYIRPTLADYANEGSWAMMTSTPEGKNWFYDQYMRGLSEDHPMWAGFRMPSWVNDKVYPLGELDPEIRDMQSDMTPEKFKQEIGAEFTEFVGRVFKDFSEESNVGKYPYNPRWPVAIATDYGFRNPNVALFVQWDVFDNVWICGEYYQSGRTAEEFAQDVWEDPKLGPMARAATLLYPDPEDPGSSAAVSNKWQVSIQSNTGGRLRDRLDLIRRWLKPQPFELEDGHPEKLPKLHIDESCRNTIREMNDYRYADTKDEQQGDAPENPIKKDDHAPEALTRFFGGRYGHKSETVGRVRQSRAIVRSR